MDPYARRALQIIAACFLLVSYVLMVVAVAVPRWAEFDEATSGVELNVGLFKSCVPSQFECSDYNYGRTLYICYSANSR